MKRRAWVRKDEYESELRKAVDGLYIIDAHPTSPDVVVCRNLKPPFRTYTVNEYGCSCPQHKYNGLCKHRCLYLSKHPRKLARIVRPIWWDDQCELDPEVAAERRRIMLALVEAAIDDANVA